MHSVNRQSIIAVFGACRLILFVKGERHCCHSANCTLWSKGEGIPHTWHYHSANCVQTPLDTSCLPQRDSSVVLISTASSAQRVAGGFACCVQYLTESRAKSYKLRLAICGDASYSRFCCANGAPAVTILKYAFIPSKAQFVC